LIGTQLLQLLEKSEETEKTLVEMVNAAKQMRVAVEVS